MTKECKYCANTKFEAEHSLNNFKSSLGNELESYLIGFKNSEESDMQTDNEKIMFYLLKQIKETLGNNGIS